MRRQLLISAFFLFAGFLFLTFLVRLDFFKPIDDNVTVFLQNKISHTFDVSFSLLSLVGSFEVAILILLVLRLIYKQLNIFYVLVFFGAFQLIEVFLKNFIRHPNPPIEFLRYHLPFSMPSSGVVQTGFSYPSGHMGRTVFISAIVLFLVWNHEKLTRVNKYIFLFLILTFDILMLISRIYLGEHWFSDVVGGSMLGLAFSLLSLSFL